MITEKGLNKIANGKLENSFLSGKLVLNIKTLKEKRLFFFPKEQSNYNL